MNEETVLEKIKAIEIATAGSSIKLLEASYTLLDFVTNNTSHKTLVKMIYNYYKTNDFSLLTENNTTWKEQLESILDTCCSIIFSGDKSFVENNGLEIKEYKNVDITRFFSFSNKLNKEFDNKLNLNRVNSYQIEKNQVAINNLINKLDEAEKNLSFMNERINNIHIDTITIISIFVAVIFALFAELKLGDNMFSKILTNDYSMTIRFSLIVLFSIIVSIYILLSITSKYTKRKTNNKLIYIVVISFVILIVLSWIII